MDGMKSQKIMTLEDERPKVRRCPICYQEKWRAITNSSRKNDAAGPKQKTMLSCGCVWW